MIPPDFTIKGNIMDSTLFGTFPKFYQEDPEKKEHKAKINNT